MRHRKSGRKLGRNSSHRKALYRNMVTSLMVHGTIHTTVPKAKELRRVADRVISLGKRVPPSALEGLEGQDLEKAKAARVHAIRLARRYITDRQALHLVFNEYSERYQARNGGYTRVVKTGFRSGDDAAMAIIQLVEDGSAPVYSDAAEDEAGVSGEEGEE